MFFRLAFESLLNILLAFLWPLFVLEAQKRWSIVRLVLGWGSYGWWAAPWVAPLDLERGKRNGSDHPLTATPFPAVRRRVRWGIV